MPKQPHLKQWSAAAIAVAAWFAVGTQLYFNVQGALSGNRDVLHSLANFFSFFTIETHIILALALTFTLARREHPIFTSPSVESALVVYIIVVGIVYSYLLSHLYDPRGLQLITNALLHDAIPIIYPIYWLIFSRKGSLRWVDPLRWLIFPCVFFVYSMLRGAAFGIYPYPFIDAAKLGYAAVCVNAVLLLAVFLGLGVVLTALDRTLAGNDGRRQSRLGRTAEL